MGGAGSAINEVLLEAGYATPVLNLGLPDEFIEHGKPEEQLIDARLDSASIEESIKQRLAAIGQQTNAGTLVQAAEKP